MEICKYDALIAASDFIFFLACSGILFAAIGCIAVGVFVTRSTIRTVALMEFRQIETIVAAWRQALFTLFFGVFAAIGRLAVGIFIPFSADMTIGPMQITEIDTFVIAGNIGIFAFQLLLFFAAVGCLAIGIFVTGSTDTAGFPVSFLQNDAITVAIDADGTGWFIALFFAAVGHQFIFWLIPILAGIAILQMKLCQIEAAFAAQNFLGVACIAL